MRERERERGIKWGGGQREGGAGREGEREQGMPRQREITAERKPRILLTHTAVYVNAAFVVVYLTDAQDVLAQSRNMTS